MGYVFISYRSVEFLEADWVRKRLEENGIKCWMAPESIPGGRDYADEINKAIINCEVLVLILSNSAQQSIQIPRELTLAIDHLKPILPFQIERCELMGGFEYRLNNLQRYFAYLNRKEETERMILRIMDILTLPHENLNVHDEYKGYTFDIDRVRFFSADGYEETVFRCRKDNEEEKLHIDVNFEPTRIREKIPAYAGAYFLMPGACDISRSQFIRFNARSEGGSITKLRVEVKPSGRRWMHESFEFELGPEEETYEIPVAGFNNPDTAKCMDEITFVIKTDAFPDEDNLRGSFEIAGLRIESDNEHE